LRARVVAEVRPQPHEFGQSLCHRSPAGRTRRVAISSSVPATRPPPLAGGTRDGDTATSAADTSRRLCGPLTWRR
jgi:hypothetical protein